MYARTKSADKKGFICMEKAQDIVHFVLNSTYLPRSYKVREFSTEFSFRQTWWVTMDDNFNLLKYGLILLIRKLSSGYLHLVN